MNGFTYASQYNPSASLVSRDPRQTGRAGVVPPIQLDCVDPEDLQNPLNIGVKAQRGHHRESRVEDDLIERTILEVWAWWLWEMLGGNNHFNEVDRIPLVSRCNEVASHGWVGSTIVAAHIRRRGGEPIVVVAGSRSGTESTSRDC